MENTLSKYYYNNLKNEEKPAYKLIKRALLQFEKVIYFPYTPNVYKVLEAVRWDCPHIFYINWITILTKIDFLSDGKVKITVPYLYKKSVIKEMMQKVRKEVMQFKSIKDPFLLAVKVHDYLAYKVKYDYDDISFGGFKYRNHNMVGAILGKSAVCEGIARAYQFILNLNGVDCMTVIGKTKEKGIVESGLHAWNIVSLNGKNYLTDVTWDLATEIAGKNRTDYAYFLLDEQLANAKHVNKVKIPINGSEKNIYRVLGRYFTEEEKFKEFLNKAQIGKGYLVRLNGILDSRIRKILNECMIKKIANCTYINSPTGVFYFRFTRV